MLVMVTLSVGLVTIAAGAVAMCCIDRRWRATNLQCCRCLAVWYSREKKCFRCYARGQAYDWMTPKFAGFPTHDWQGYLPTGPIPCATPPSHHPRLTISVCSPVTTAGSLVLGVDQAPSRDLEATGRTTT